MYSEKLERLIQLSIEDGVIDETENAVLIKCAKEEGVDIDELTLYVNSLVKKRQRELESEVTSKVQKYEKEKKEAIGNICPKCGKQIPPMSIKCPYCGCELVNKKANSSVKELVDKIEKIRKDGKADQEDKEARISELINLFPVPNSKETILEFLALSAPLSKTKNGLWGSITGRFILLVIFLLFVFICISVFFPDWSDDGNEIRPVFFLPMALIGGLTAIFLVDRDTLKWNKDARVWRAKFDQVMMKARSIQGDSEFQKQIDYYENSLKGTGGGIRNILSPNQNTNLSPNLSSKTLWIVIALLVIVILFLVWPQIKMWLYLNDYIDLY